MAPRIGGALLSRAQRAWIVATLIPVVLLTTWPAHSFVGHSHWPSVEWVPLSRIVVPRDVVANIAIFVPLGLAVAWPGGRRRIAVALAASAALSISAELYQVYCHGAFPTTMDVLSNTLGAGLGAIVAHRVAASRRAGPRLLSVHRDAALEKTDERPSVPDERSAAGARR